MIDIKCDDCGDTIEVRDYCYCEKCFDNKEDEIEKKEKQIEELENEVVSCEKFISKLEEDNSKLANLAGKRV